MSTGTELIALVREQTHLDSDDASDAVILGHLNRAIEIVGTRFDWPWLQDEDTITTVADQQPYDWPTDAVYIDTLVETDKRTRLKKISSMEAWSRYGDDPPTTSARSFYLWNDKIVLVENPPAADIVLKVKFHKQATVMASAAGTPEWNDQFHEFLSDFACARLWESEEDQAMAQTSEQRFEEGLADMVNFYNDQASDERMVWGEQPDRYVATSGNMPWLNGV